MRRGAEAYRAYAQGDYLEAELSTNPTAIEGLPAGEVRHSMLLLYAFSLEGEGKADEAIETYRSLVRDAPLSFAADDARERLRILERTEADPDYAGWVAAARERAAICSWRSTVSFTTSCTSALKCSALRSISASTMMSCRISSAASCSNRSSLTTCSGGGGP